MTSGWAGRFLSGASFWTPDFPGDSRTSWVEHAPFAFWLIDAARPATFVELGTHTGFSYLAFCQAVSRLQIGAKGFAVDTWEGDEHTGFYGPEILAELSSYHDPRYGAFSRLVQTTFDDAVATFEDGSIDLLHVDGLHTYDAVRHDFDTWLPKLSTRAIVLLHDTNVRERGFGVHRLWTELRGEHPGFEFVHAHGLGVLGVGDELPVGVAALFEADSDRDVTAGVRTAYAHLGSTVRLRFEVGVARDAIRAGEDDRAELANRLAARDAEAGSLRERVGSLEEEVGSLEEEVGSLEQQVRSLEEARAAAETGLREAEARAAASRATAADLQNQLLITLDSKSWRLTRPLRTSVGAARRLLRTRRPEAASFPALTSATGGGARGARTRVVFVSGEADTPGHGYRIERVAASLPPRYFETAVLTPSELPSHTHELENVDVLWIWRAAYSDELAAAMNAARAGSGAIVYDVDDLMFLPDLARIEVIDGIRTRGLTESDVKGGFEAVQRALTEADRCTAPTATLARQLHALGRPSTVVPNTFDSSFLRSARAAQLRHASSGEQVVRIGYAAGSFTHQSDLAVVMPALARVLREHPEARFVTFERTVDLREFPELDGLHGQIETRPLVPLEQLSAEYARFDVNLAPLEAGNPFCEAKSELKFFEAALAGVPTVASPTEPFVAAIRHGQTGFLATREDEWYEALSSLVGDAAFRSSVAAAAYQDVLWQFGPERLSSITMGLVHELVDRRPHVAGPSHHAIADESASRPPIEIPEYEVLYESSTAPPSRVAVVMPVHNYETYIEEALESVRAQTFRELDLVIVDDCSTDESVEVARRWLERHRSRFNRAALLRNLRNSKLAPTRNAAITYADSELFLPLDPDNQLLPDCIEKAVAHLDDSGAAFAFPIMELFGDERGRRQDVDWDPSRLRRGNYIDAMALVRRACWIAVGGYSPMEVTGWEDYDFWCKFVENGFYGTHVPAVMARYRVHSRSMLATITTRPENLARVIDEMTRRHPWLDIAAPAGGNGEAQVVTSPMPIGHGERATVDRGAAPPE